MNRRGRLSWYTIIVLVTAVSLGVVWFALWLVFIHPLTGIVHAQGQVAAADYGEGEVVILPPMEMNIWEAIRKDRHQIEQQRQDLPSLRVDKLPDDDNGPEPTPTPVTDSGIVATNTPTLVNQPTATQTGQLDVNATPSNTPDLSDITTLSPTATGTDAATMPKDTLTPTWTAQPFTLTLAPGFTSTKTPIPTGISPTKTGTVSPPTETSPPPTGTSILPTKTPIPPSTDTPVPPPTNTPIPPTDDPYP